MDESHLATSAHDSCRLEALCTIFTAIVQRAPIGKIGGANFLI